jgi:chloramphenicol O-acetyltransferase
MSSLAAFRLYCGVIHIILIKWCLMLTLAVFQLYHDVKQIILGICLYHTRKTINIANNFRMTFRQD